MTSSPSSTSEPVSNERLRQFALKHIRHEGNRSYVTLPAEELQSVANELLTMRASLDAAERNVCELTERLSTEATRRHNTQVRLEGCGAKVLRIEVERDGLRAEYESDERELAVLKECYSALRVENAALDAERIIHSTEAMSAKQLLLAREADIVTITSERDGLREALKAISTALPVLETVLRVAMKGDCLATRNAIDRQKMVSEILKPKAGGEMVVSGVHPNAKEPPLAALTATVSTGEKKGE